MRTTFYVLILAVFAALVGLAIAAPASDVSVTADTVVTLTGYTSVELLTLDGNATFYFTDGTDTMKTRYGRDGIVRYVEWTYHIDGIDTLRIDIDTASEVIYTLN